ncbi:DNA replication and repair protein RadA [Mariprofundus ferrinatatus]|uniref:DNA repair protein RadA n=1 Tax=Mariprofundus ferrinatatus TaxID=1921087 RepID=A0A2K8LDR6_9PROT|nr:DNA repair protein RadA [Mariprofundus ferrinatatus]ATX82426.1 DNA replication and repair protein RadA [Mariprofundus ferrinatatus]
MAKSIFVCQSCGAEHRKWIGQCPDCGDWNSISEQVIEAGLKRTGGKGKALATSPITSINRESNPRRSSRIEELDRVLGGGIVPGSAVLIGGDPGIGKSTLLLQAAARLAAHGNRPVLYITGEESITQVHLRGERIESMHENLLLVSACELESMLATIGEVKPETVIVDSIQTTVSNRLSSAPGTVSQVRDCAAALIQNAKQTGHALILVGHVTKEGALAGPRVLEHMVDAVIYFEGDRGHAHRILRTVKNRFGPAGEIGVFEMTDRGLIGIRDASRLFLAERSTDTPGSVVLACMEGTRPLLVEVQALVAPTVYSTPKRSAVGLDTGRVAMLTAVLERRIGIPLSQHDVYVNIAGGARIAEPAADLAVLLAMVSAFQERPVADDVALFGEVGLTGEVRPVGQPESRAREAANLGFTHLLLPGENHQRVQKANIIANMRGESGSPLRLSAVRHLSDAVQKLLT